jgi:3',5'-cyclic AMP phosphodiesterase CpdA
MTRGISINRRSFLKAASLCSGVYLFQPLALGANEIRNSVCFGLIADVHQDIMHDSPERVSAFTSAMNEAGADFVCQLGDFCWPQEKNREFLQQWGQFEGPRYHVLGNHDMDGGAMREQTVAFYGMPAMHYSFDRGSVHFIVLDGNEPGGQSTGYPRYVSQEQLDWIAEDLNVTSLPTIVFSHQALDDISGGVENSDAVRRILEQATTESGRKKVAACFCGHHHADHAYLINGIHYIHINSASYKWLGDEFRHESYSEEIHQKYPWISRTAPYKDPLWAYVEIDPTQGRLIVKGRSTSWVGPNPWELGAAEERSMGEEPIEPKVSDRNLEL